MLEVIGLRTLSSVGKRFKPTYSIDMKPMEKTICSGCGAYLKAMEGPTHSYMEGSPACFALFNQLLVCEYSDRSLLPTHRLTVDTYAVQHPGQAKTRKQIQSVGLHLARLGLQLENLHPPKETNDVMLGLGKHKHTLEYIEPPKQFSTTVADIAEFAGTTHHSDKVRDWATSTWDDWSDQHDYIVNWVEKWL